MNALETPPSPSCCAGEADAASACWRLEITATPEPLLLARALQKLAVPEIELLAVDYDAGAATGEARASLRFLAAAPRARLVTARVRKLWHIRSALLIAVLC